MSTWMWLSAKLRALKRAAGRPALVALTALAAGVWLVACHDSQPIQPQHEHSVSVVNLDRTTLTLKTGEQATLSAAPTCTDGVVLDSTVTWASSDASVASVTSDGVVTAESFGTATITASAAGKSATATVVVEPAGTIVGPAGATVVSTDGNLTLEIPEGALAAETDVVIAPVEAAAFGGDPLYIGGTGYEIKPAALQLQERARLRIHFDAAGVPDGVSHQQLRIRERDRQQNQWQDCEHLQLREQEREVEAWVQRFGTYGIVVKPAAGTLIGVMGGTVVSVDGNVELEIPAGALDSATDIVITKADDTEFADEPPYVDGTAYDMQPEGLQFKSPASLRIHFDSAKVPDGVSQEQLRIRERDRAQNRWRDCDHMAVQQNFVQGKINHFSTYAIVAGASPSNAVVVASVTVSPSVVEVTEGSVIQLSADVRDAEGNSVDVAVSWSSSDPSVATVDGNGRVTGLAAGSVTITASAGGVRGQAPVNVKRKGPPPAAISVDPTTASIAVGGTVQLTAEVRDADGNTVDKAVSWSSSANAVAAVSGTGLVTGVAEGTATITARLQNLSATATITVNPPVSSIVIDGIGNEPLEIGSTLQLNATAYNGSGQPVPVTLKWSSSNEGVATVDQAGLVTGTGRGTASITASVGTASASVDVRVVGESTGEEETGNNMSWPVVFADGVGLTGSAPSTDPGVRPGTAEAITVDTLPFFWEGNVATYELNGVMYYEQQTSSTWRAEWLDGAGQPPYDAEAAWGDNLTVREWSATKPIRIEVALSATGVGTLEGYNMTSLYGEGRDEMLGTDGSTGEFVPLIYAVGATLIVERLSGEGGSVVATAVNTPIGSEVNVSGRIIYGYLLRLDEWTPPSGATLDGWYRLRFVLPGSANVNITSVGNSEGTFLPVVVNSKESMMEIHVTP